MAKKPDEADRLLDFLLSGKSVEEIIGKGGLLNELQRRLLQRGMNAEMTHHLGYDKHSPAGRGSGNSRNGSSRKTLLTDTGEIDIEVPRDRNGEFEPMLVPRHQRRLSGFDQQVLALYSRGMTTRDIQHHLEDLYEVQISPALVSAVTDAVIDEVKEWQSRPLDAIYPIVWLDALHLKSRWGGHV